MNQAPTAGYEEDVGARTTHHVMYPESAIDLDNGTSLVLVPFKTLDLQWIISALTTGTITHTYTPVTSRIKANKDKVLIYNPTFFKYVYESWLEGHGRYPSTGFLSLMLAVHICDEVTVFGFGADQYGNWHHYWEENTLSGAFRHTGVHDGDHEYNVTLQLAEKHKIQIMPVESPESRTVEVRALPAAVDEELLFLYFENKRRSGGGPLVSVEKSGDRAVLVFEEAEGEWKTGFL
ncbi:CMP-N-acetylneuraminate-beta-galactosamide-alpha-2,3-sialyltransferase 1 [Liparis tanakae]|uniref:CMP-N-acetylneuraminate-beta-galactosamide-alpha-2,3-sialyltransferase 1 n=1 Tax=Liparis tanakae TaxID=230148 RepID=A0A4Z2FZC2_9TELE|nr:CMP-N-acetylneuraminate-beta-galactosamide-alpha-2,3-sialyltransferase 1 [Liparis tanakae]